MPSKRIYTEKEISAVLERAAELQRRRGPTHRTGLTLDELEAIAAEAGLDPDLVQAAAQELDEGTTDRAFHLLGAPVTVELERTVEGEMTVAKWEETVVEIRRIYEGAEEIEPTGRTREWTRRGNMEEKVHVTLTPTGDQTRIRISYSMAVWATVLHVPLISVAIAPIIIQFVFLDLGPFLETGLALLIAMVFFLAGWIAFRGISDRKEREARRLLTRLDALIAAPETREALPERAEYPEQEAAPQTGRIDPSLLLDDALEDAPPARQRTGGRTGQAP